MAGGDEARAILHTLADLRSEYERKAKPHIDRLAALRAPPPVIAPDMADALDALRFLLDEQNGPPLADRADRWRDAMVRASYVLTKHGW